MQLLIIFLGGGSGALARHAMGLMLGSSRFGQMALPGGNSLPLPILLINLAGALGIGLFAGFEAARGSMPALRLLLVTGFLGGFTTFSAFSLDSALMLQRGDYGTLAVYIAASVIGTIALAVLGHYAGRLLGGG